MAVVAFPEHGASLMSAGRFEADSLKITDVN